MPCVYHIGSFEIVPSCVTGDEVVFRLEAEKQEMD